MTLFTAKPGAIWPLDKEKSWKSTSTTGTERHLYNIGSQASTTTTCNQETAGKHTPAGRPSGTVCIATSLGKNKRLKLKPSVCIQRFVLHVMTNSDTMKSNQFESIPKNGPGLKTNHKQGKGFQPQEYIVTMLCCLLPI